MHEDFFERFDAILGQSRQFALVCHVNPDGDAIGSMLAMSFFLRQKGHQVKMVCPNAFPGFLAWLPGATDILVYDRDEEQSKIAIADAECIILLDFNTLSRSGVLHNEIGKTRCQRVMIDHHRDPDLDHLACYYSDTCVSSASEIVAEIILHYGADRLTQDMATALMVGIMTDTGCFSHSIYHSRTFDLCSFLMEQSIPYPLIHQRIYDSFSENRLRLLGYAINKKMEVLQDFAVAIISLTKNELESFNYQVGDTEGIVNFPLSIEKIKMSVLVTERADQIRLSFRSKGSFSVHELAHKHFKGGGHTNAAGGITTIINMKTTIKRLKAILGEYDELRYDE
ncbi:MAG: bifunctional oligoribonuclease/PAP phosphatase NrnA [Bacteroidales bacterium]|nr:bifunctional oligoribonuclease/PAP phosphatase NrnA [Bacteroidales bacterium]